MKEVFEIRLDCLIIFVGASILWRSTTDIFFFVIAAVFGIGYMLCLLGGRNEI